VGCWAVTRGRKERRRGGLSWAGVEEKKKERNGPRGREKEGRAEPLLGWVGLVSSFPISFFSLFSFLFQTNSNYLFRFKSNLNSNSYALNQKEFMHQHECTNMLNIGKKFKYL